ncbi:cytochrome b/b6 domain-containing protein [Alteromonas facilis]|uniref:cytochrome b/b6 domain-containing protein n=1 Tax=Alteromonas facilis TaxID=2048004 RepID=UPI000C286599|nr:cytochrome b/b6 domain-containing protein [Alteromonas facilis]
MKRQTIWDIPTRIFHWLLVASFAFQWVSAELLDDAILWHARIGYALLGLIMFRIVWGFIGTRFARFSSLSLSPKETLTYSKQLLNKSSKEYAGHNPVGSWAVVMILVLMALQAISGLFVSDDVFTEGPYRSAVSSSVLNVMEFIHFNLFNLLLAIVVLHVVAVLFYQFYKGQALINAMITGKKWLKEDVGINSSRLVLAVILAAVVAAGVYVLVEVLPPEPEFYY